MGPGDLCVSDAFASLLPPGMGQAGLAGSWEDNV